MRGAREIVAWKDICLSKSEDSLGIKALESWNKAGISKLKDSRWAPSSISISDSDIRRALVVNKIWKDSRWRQPDPLSEDIEEAWTMVRNITGDNDEKICVLSRIGQYTIKFEWEILHDKRQKVSWDRLAMKQRLKRWDLIEDDALLLLLKDYKR
ncbi:hypothetical protein EPI10_016844 [Gossypium australe]|uniref:Uncharacterized protein n=1 Tax=Gossypium australe TaxID=47621 RepID=A0A5B6VQ37_9ROSI|nr:hypothetical protein EPI10_016844 [Gossypium australe]